MEYRESSIRETDRQNTILIWDSDTNPQFHELTTILWRSFNTDKQSNLFSIPKMIEDNAEKLRDQYLSFIFQIGQAHTGKKKIIDYFEIRRGFSYWWMTQIVEKSYAKSSQPYEIIKFFALEDFIGTKCKKIILHTANPLLKTTFQSWCRKAGMEFECHKLRDKVPSKRLLYRIFPRPVLAIIRLFTYVAPRWVLKKKAPLINNSDIVLINYLNNFDKQQLKQGIFQSAYWTDLPGYFTDIGVSYTWMHLLTDAVFSHPRAAKEAIKNINHTPIETQWHELLDENLNSNIIFNVIKDYVYITIRAFFLRKDEGKFTPVGSKINFWQIIKEDWNDSFYGPAAISNYLHLNLFEEIFKNRKAAKIGFYLQENQGWEAAFIYAWKAAGNGKLVGIPHATVRFWDLRYFSDRRNFDSKERNSMPKPDLVALNGKAALNAYKSVDYPHKEVVEVEALRYLHLLVSPNSRKDSFKETGKLKILILGDYVPSITHHQIQWLSDVIADLPTNTELIVKPHPNCPIHVDVYPDLKLKIDNSPISHLVKNCDVAYTSNITSAAVDAYFAGIPVVSVLNGGTFNMSPLRECEGVYFVFSSHDLAKVIKTAAKSATNFERTNYFTINPTIPLWKELVDKLLYSANLN